MIRFWVDEFDIDGIRLDCANILDFNFMKEMRTKTASMKPDFWLMGEVIHGDYSRWVNPEMLHSVTNYELHKSIYSGFNDHNFFETPTMYVVWKLLEDSFIPSLITMMKTALPAN